MTRKRHRAAKLWSLHPSLHQDVLQILNEEGLQMKFLDIDGEMNPIVEKDTNIMGRFDCPSKACHSRGWSSKKIAITIRLYPEQKYNARVYHQRCKYCKTIGKLILDRESYVERVAYRLKKWSGIEVQSPVFSGSSKGPHDNQLCEGCKAGHCSNTQPGLSSMLAR